MIIDIFFALLLLLALIKGYRNGLIIAVFSIIALLIGLAAAIKLSAFMAGYLKDSIHVSMKWLPVISFIVVFFIAVFLVRLGATAIEKMVKLAMLGWLNRLGGILLYAILYIIILSVGIFYVDRVHLLTPQAIASSKTYSFIRPWGPWAIDGIGTILPFFKNMFQQLEAFFGEIGRIKK